MWTGCIHSHNGVKYWKHTQKRKKFKWAAVMHKFYRTLAIYTEEKTVLFVICILFTQHIRYTFKVTMCSQQKFLQHCLLDWKITMGATCCIVVEVQGTVSSEAKVSSVVHRSAACLARINKQRPYIAKQLSWHTKAYLVALRWITHRTKSSNASMKTLSLALLVLHVLADMCSHCRISICGYCTEPQCTHQQLRCTVSRTFKSKKITPLGNLRCCMHCEVSQHRK